MIARWRVDVIGKKLHHLGSVVAGSEQEAIEGAIKQLNIEPAQQFKIAVTKVSDKEL